jgi:hypothetical protein
MSTKIAAPVSTRGSGSGANGSNGSVTASTPSNASKVAILSTDDDSAASAKKDDSSTPTPSTPASATTTTTGNGVPGRPASTAPDLELSAKNLFSFQMQNSYSGKYLYHIYLA